MLQVERVTARLGDHISQANFNFHVNKGETFGILGDGNAGKTELIQLLSGMRSPENGTVKIADCTVHQNIRRAQQHVSVLSRTLALFPAMSVEDNLMFWGRLYDLSANTLPDKINSMLAQVGYEGHRKEAVADLTVLDQKRVHLAAALIHEPKLLLLDQPTERMSADERDAFIQLVLQLQHTGLTMVYATDKIDEIQHVADRVAILDEGRILAEGTVDELRSLLDGQSQIVVRCRPLQTLVSCVEEAAIVHTVDEEKSELRIWTTKPTELLSQMFSDWQQNGVVTQSVRVVEPTLAGVYLHLTGKSLDV